MVLYLVILLPLCGCLGRSQPTRFYLLQPISGTPAEQPAAGKAAGMRIGVGPITLPDYVDRPQIVTLVGPHELNLAEFDQWSEPLIESVPRILAENVSVLLSTQHVYPFPWLGSMQIDYQVEVDVNRFDTTQGGEAVLNARWTILAGDGKEILLRKHSAITQEAGGTGYDSVVAAESRVLEQLSREIASAIKSIEQGK